MKKILLLSVFFALLIAACDSFTEVSLPDTQLTAPAVFDTDATAKAAMTDIYTKMRDNGLLSGRRTGMSHQLGLYADELEFFGTAGSQSFGFANNAVLPTANEVQEWWNSSYSQIYAANSVIEGISASHGMTQPAKDMLMGEALFVRAFIHTNLANVFGPVPYITTTDYQANSTVSRQPYQAVLSQARTDLHQAVDLLPTEYAAPDRTRPNRFAAWALLARINLYLGDWPAAADAASAVLNEQGLYPWVTDLSQSYLKTASTTVWQFAAGTAGYNTHEGNSFIFQAGPPPQAALSQQLISAFEAGDLRFVNWTRLVTTGSQSWRHVNKYKQAANTPTTVELSIQLATPELVLIRAEAKARQGELVTSKEDVDRIRSRAGLAPTGAITQEGLLQAILTERRVELFCEHGHRFFDLRRLGQLDSALGFKPGWQATDRLLPIPDRDLMLNPNLAPQNEGY